MAIPKPSCTGENLSNTDSNGNRTHEPNLRELTAELDGLGSLMQSQLTGLEKLLNERDRRYSERDADRQKAIDAALAAADKAVQAALVGADKAVQTALLTQKEAVTKAEAAQSVYNQGHNDLLKKMDSQHKETLPRNEADEKFKGQDAKIENLRDQLQSDTKAVREQIAGLRESRSEAVGATVERTDNRLNTAGMVGLWVGGATVLYYVVQAVTAASHVVK